MTERQRLAREVLGYFGVVGGIQAGSFRTRLFDAISVADYSNLEKLLKVYPDEVSFFQMASLDEHGIERLKQIAEGTE